MDDAFAARRRACQERLREVGADAAVLFPSDDLYYLTGFREEPMERHLLLFVPVEGDPAMLVPALYEAQVGEAVAVDDLRAWDDGEDPGEYVAAVAADLDIADGHLLLDDHMWAMFTQDLRETLPDATFGLASEVTADLRLRKDERELDALRRAGALADRVSVEIRERGADVVGLTEAELAAEVEGLLAARGGGDVSFEVICGSGPNGAKPHHTHGDRTIERGDPVVLDFGAYVDGYPGDQTRTCVFASDPPEGFEAVHETVLAAHEAGVDAVEPGIEAQAVDRAAREVIAEAGYGDEFVHRTGHGVGLDVHEPPYIVEGNETTLEPGMVFSVEPGVYLEGEFGVRIEDLVVVTENGCERLNDSPRGWRPL